MIDTTRVTDALPVVSGSASSVSVLPASFPGWIVADPEYASSCEFGVLEFSEEGRTRYTWYEVQEYLVLNVARAYEHEDTPLPYCVGYAYGWLSSLALCDMQLALRGLRFLSLLIATVRKVA